MKSMDIVDAAERGDWVTVTKTLRLGGSVNVRNHKKNTALMYACSEGCVEIMKKLITHGADINLKDCVGLSAIHWASLKGHIEVVRELIASGANINLKDNTGHTALMLACLNGYTAIVVELITHKANITDEDNDGSNAFMLACQEGHIEVVRELIAQDVYIDYENYDGNTAIMLACLHGKVNIVRELIAEGADIDHINIDGSTAFLWACQEGDIEVVQVLISQGVNIHDEANDGSNPLIWACREGHIEVVRTLVAHGAYLNHEDNCGYTALMLAGDIEIMRELIDHGADINHQNKFGNTVFTLACRRGHVEVVKNLIAMGVDIEHKSSDGSTALMLACQGGHAEVARELIAHKANVNCKKKDGYTALMLACQNGHGEVVKELVDCKADINLVNCYGDSAFTLACRRGHVEVVKSLIASGMDIKCKSVNGMTALMLACQSGHVKVARELIARGTDIDCEDNSGNTALMWACREGNIGVVRDLVSCGTDTKRKNKKGHTALMIAHQEKHETIARELTGNSTDFNRENDVFKLTVRYSQVSNDLFDLLKFGRHVTSLRDTLTHTRSTSIERDLPDVGEGSLAARSAVFITNKSCASFDQSKMNRSTTHSQLKWEKGNGKWVFMQNDKSKVASGCPTSGVGSGFKFPFGSTESKPEYHLPRRKLKYRKGLRKFPLPPSNKATKGTTGDFFSRREAAAKSCRLGSRGFEENKSTTGKGFFTSTEMTKIIWALEKTAKLLKPPESSDSAEAPAPSLCDLVEEVKGRRLEYENAQAAIKCCVDDLMRDSAVPTDKGIGLFVPIRNEARRQYVTAIQQCIRSSAMKDNTDLLDTFKSLQKIIIARDSCVHRSGVCVSEAPAKEKDVLTQFMEALEQWVSQLSNPCLETDTTWKQLQSLSTALVGIGHSLGALAGKARSSYNAADSDEGDKAPLLELYTILDDVLGIDNKHDRLCTLLVAARRALVAEETCLSRNPMETFPIELFQRAIVYSAKVIEQEITKRENVHAVVGEMGKALDELIPWVNSEPDCNQFDTLIKEQKRLKIELKRLDYMIEVAMDENPEQEQEQEVDKLKQRMKQLHRDMQINKRKQAESKAALARIAIDHFPELPLKHPTVRLSPKDLPEVASKYFVEDRLLSDYSNVEVLSQTVKSTVYRGHFAGREVVLKEYRLSDTSQQRTLSREVCILAAHSHSPYITSINSIFFETANMKGFLEMPYYHNGSLTQYLASDQGETLSVIDRRAILQRVCTGIAYLHSQGIVHCDVKLANVLIDNSGLPVVADFDISRNLVDSQQRSQTTMTTTGGVRGTTSYMSPETLPPENQRCGKAGDMYSFGVCILHVMGLPCERNSSTNCHDVPSSEACEAIHPNVCNILMRLFSKSPDQRPTASETLDDSFLSWDGLAATLSALEAATKDRQHELDRVAAECEASRQIRLRTCCLCGDEDKEVSEGVECDGMGCGETLHFTCAECFDCHVRAECTKDLGMRRWIQIITNDSHVTQCIRRNKASIERIDHSIVGHASLDSPWSNLSELSDVFQVVDFFTDRMCVLCPMHKHGCDGQPFDDHVVVKNISPSVLSLYDRGKKELLEWRLTSEHDERLAQEKKRIAALSERERDIEEARLHIVEEILTLKCPRTDCKQAFVDFDGCYALTCSRCHTGFCAYCLKDCGRDAHRHVARCMFGNGRGIYGGQEGMRGFNEVQTARKTRVLDAYLNTLDTALKRDVKNAIRQDLIEIGINHF